MSDASSSTAAGPHVQQPPHGQGAPEITLRFTVKASDAGPDGVIDGGVGLQWIDRAGYACAARWSGSYSVTVYVGDTWLRSPVAAGNLVEVHARLIHTGRSSMHILATIKTLSNLGHDPIIATRCIIVFVAVDEHGSSRQVPQWIPSTDSERELQQFARAQIATRRHIDAVLGALRFTTDSSALRKTLRVLATPGDVNWGGNVHGGNIMKWIDDAGTVCTQHWVGRGTLASHIGAITFLEPVHIGDIVEIEARLIHTGHRSMHVAVHVRAIDARTGQQRLCTRAVAVYVVLDEHGRAMQVPQWCPTLPDDVSHDTAAQAMIEARSCIAIPDTATDTSETEGPALTSARALQAMELAMRRAAILGAGAAIAVVDTERQLLCCGRTDGATSSLLRTLLDRATTNNHAHDIEQHRKVPEICWGAVSLTTRTAQPSADCPPTAAVVVASSHRITSEDIVAFVVDELACFDKRHRKNLS